MRKNFLKIASVFTLASVLFFACKKDEPVVETCGATLLVEATAFEAKADAFELKIDADPRLYTKTECAALRIEAVNLVAKAKACPQTSTNVELIKELDALILDFQCL